MMKSKIGEWIIGAGVIMIFPLQASAFIIYVWSIVLAAKVSVFLTVFTICVPFISQIYWMFRVGWAAYTFVILGLLALAELGGLLALVGNAMVDKADENR